MSRIRHAVLSSVIAGCLVAAGSTPAFAGGNGAQTFTENLHNQVDDIGLQNVCGVTAEVTITHNSVFHVTQLAGGEFWVTGTDEGWAVATVVDGVGNPTGLVYTGHFATWFGESFNEKNDVQHDTFNIVLKGSDGSTIRMHAADHLSTNAQGDIVVAFEKANCF